MNLYTSRERKGLTILLLTTAVLLVFNYMLPFLFKPSVVDYSVLFVTLEDSQEQLHQASKGDIPLVEISPFDVNEISMEGLQEIGLSKSVAKAWINYRNALGGFRKIEQMGKIYGLESKWLASNKANLLFPGPRNNTNPQVVIEQSSIESSALMIDPNTSDLSDRQAAGLKEETIAALQKYKNRGGSVYRKEEMVFLAGINDSSFAKKEASVAIESEFLPPLLNDTINMTNRGGKKALAKSNVTIDINDSNEYQWQELKGVGPYYARSIIKYRNLLGGFARVDQVAETYNLPDSVFQTIKPYLLLSPIVNKIPINSISVDSLRLHPYLNWKQASILVNYRNNHGPYEKLSDFYKIRVFDSVFVKKIEPYITF